MYFNCSGSKSKEKLCSYSVQIAYIEDLELVEEK